MAIYHLSVQVVSRGQGKSCIAAAAYRAGEKLHDERQNLNHDYTRKQEIESEIIAPSNAPSWINDREKLWNEVDKKETRCNSRTAREINVALPIELSKEEQKGLVRKYVKENFVDKGMVADVCFHFNDEKNPHCHVMLTTREINQNGFNNKNRDWDKKEKVQEWREQWAKQTNKLLDKAGCNRSIDHRSYKDQGIDQLPTIHLGKTSSEMQKKGLVNPRVDINNQIKELNKQKVIVLKEYRELKNKLDEARRYSNLEPEEKEAIQRVEKLVNKPQTYVTLKQTYETSKQALDKLKSNWHEQASELTFVNFHANTLKSKNQYIIDDLRYLQKSEMELKTLPKNIFGQYKNKDRVKIIRYNINKYNDKLINDGYKSDDTIKLNQKKLDHLKNESNQLKLYLESIDQDTNTNTIEIGIKALENKELRDFQKKYNDQFPQIKHLRYTDIENIKLTIEIMGRFAPIEEIRTTYHKSFKRIDSIDGTIRQIEDNSQRLKHAKECFETIDEYKDIVDKWDTKLFGKEKFHEKYKEEKWMYDNSIKDLKEHYIDDKLDLKTQVIIHESDINELQPKLKAEKAAITSSIDVLKYALQSLDEALSAEKSIQRLRQEGKNLENEWGPEM